MEIVTPDIKMIAIDIDGTLLTPEQQIAPATITAVQAAQREGIIVTLATARRYLNTFPIADELGIDIPLILSDGAMIMMHPETMVMHTYPLASAIAQQAVDIMVRHCVQPVVHHVRGIVEEIWTGPPTLDNQWLKLYFSEFPDNLYRMPTKELCIGKPDPLRVVAFASEDDIYSLVPEIAALSCSWNSIKRGNFGSAEIAVMASGCSKAMGVETLARHFHIPLSQVMAIGDNNNDLEMIQAVGWGVAMGHAPDAVKAVANAVTTTNSENGVARAIERYALGRSVCIADSNSFNLET